MKFAAARFLTKSMDTSELDAADVPHPLSDGPLAKSSSLPSIPTLFRVAFLIPAAAALSNQWLLDRSRELSWSLNHFAAPAWLTYCIYPWMALSAAIVSWSAGRYLYPTFLRCIVFVWCLGLLDLLTFLASLTDTHRSQFGYMLFSAQVNLLIVWTILGDGGWQWRLPMMLAVAPIVWLLGGSIGSTWWLDGGAGTARGFHKAGFKLSFSVVPWPRSSVWDCDGAALHCDLSIPPYKMTINANSASVNSA